MIKVHIDGAANQKTDTAGIGVLLIENGIQRQHFRKLDSFLENHECEFLALLEALDILQAEEKNGEIIFCYSDSRVVTEAVRKHYTGKAAYRPYLEEILKRTESFPTFYLKWIPEKDNRGADQLAKRALR